MASNNLAKLKRKAAELEQKKQFEKALAMYVQFLDEVGRDLEDADLQLYNRVGDLLMRQGSTSEGLAYYERAIDVYADRGYLNNAIALCNKILRQSPARTSVYYKLGRISANKGFKNDAKRNFLEYADRMRQGGNINEAFRALKEFADLCPDMDEIRLMLADMLQKEDRKGEAIEQLERLHAKLESEGRHTEAAATVERIKAIDPDITIRRSGEFKAVQENDLIFLDLTVSAGPAAIADPLPEVQPSHLTPQGEAIGALQGLTITFLPDQHLAAGTPQDVAPVDGLDRAEPETPESVAVISVLEEDAYGGAQDLPIIALDGMESTAAQNVDDDDDVIARVDGLASTVVTLSGVNPLEAPLIENPPLSSEEFGAIRLSGDHDVHGPAAHDLAISTSLPLLDADDASARNGDHGSDKDDERDNRLSLEDAPDVWAAAALAAPRDNPLFDHLLTPLHSAVIRESDTEPPDDSSAESPSVSPELLAALDARDPDQPLPDEGLIHLLHAPFAAQEADNEASEGDSDDFIDPIHAPFGAADAPSGADTNTDKDTEARNADGDDTDAGDAEFEDRDPTESGAPRVESANAEAEVGSDGHDVTGSVLAADTDEPLADEVDVEDAIVAESTAAASPGSEPSDASSDTLSDTAEVEAQLDPQLEPSAHSDEDSSMDPEFALEDLIAKQGHGAAASALDLTNLPAPKAVSAEMPAFDVDSLTQNPDGDLVRSAFQEKSIDLPLIDTETDEDAFDASASVDDMLASQPSFEGTSEETAFDPEPLSLEDSEREWDTAEEEAAEVLIDGEWRDEIGELASGEMSAIDGPRSRRRPAFDDLAAAMLYVNGNTPPDGSEGIREDGSAARLSFGGAEPQLRRRLELDPVNATLRRSLGEVLLDRGDREGGLNELELACRGFEGQGDLRSARDVVNVILLVVPLSVRHHQKRIEYAVRTNDRAALIDAYIELADALFRCGEPDKAKVVYSRVVELSPTNDRARFALGVLGEHQGSHRSSDEIPIVVSGLLSGGPSVTMADLTPDTLDATIPVGTSDIDAEIEAAFISDHATPASALEALTEIERWAASQASPDPVAPPPRVEEHPAGFVDLTSWMDDITPPRSLRMVAEDVTPTGDEAADFQEMLRRFKAGVSESVDAEDYRSHYDLGVAFKEMGLLDEAIAQFQKSMRGEDERVRSYEALGTCFVEREQYAVAAALLGRAVDSPGVDDQQMVGVLYLLAYSHEALGRSQDAIDYYQRVFAVDIAFRDVTDRLAALERVTK